MSVGHGMEICLDDDNARTGDGSEKEASSTCYGGDYA